jgi:hypothetical protein
MVSPAHFDVLDGAQGSAHGICARNDAKGAITLAVYVTWACFVGGLATEKAVTIVGAQSESRRFCRLWLEAVASAQR